NGNPVRAEKVFREAIALLEPVCKRHPDDRRYPYELAKAYDWLAAALQRNRERLEKADGPHCRAIGLLTDLSRAHPRDTRYLYWLAHAQANRSVSCSRMKQYQPAAEAIQQSIKLYRQLYEGNRVSWEYRQMLCQSLATLAEIQNYAKRPRDAEAPAREAVAMA